MHQNFTHTVSISRKTTTGNKRAFSEVSTGVPCHIQPTTGVFENGQWGRVDKSFLLFSQTEIRIGDQLTDQDGKEYEVVGSQFLSFRGRSHYECQLRGV